MKLTIYHIVNKETRKSIYGNCRRREVEQYLATLENAEQFEIVAHYNTCVWGQGGGPPSVDTSIFSAAR